MSTMGIDIGTTGCKAGVFDAEGRLGALAYREYPLLSLQPHWAELDSARVLQACIEVIREAAAAAREPVRALGISCQGEAFTPIGLTGELLAHAMVSSDARAEPIVASWSRQFGAWRLYELTGHTPHPMFTIFKLLWLRQHRPDVWSAAQKFYCFEELLQWRLGVEPAISWPLAGRTMLLNVRSHQWEPEILAAVGLEAARLAPPVASGSVVGVIPPGVARNLGVAPEAVVVAGGHDQPCGALGAGVVEPGFAMYATGTVECICPAFDRPIFSEGLFQNNLCTYDHVIEGMYTTVAFSLTGGNLLRWFRDQWGHREREEARRAQADPYELILRGMAPEPTDLMVLPYFTPSGTPYFDAHTPGAILGLRLSTTRGELLRGLLEGVAFEMRLNVEILRRAGLEVRQFRAIGGGAKSRALTQLKADVLGCPITTVAVTEAGCLGAAMLACAAISGTRAQELVAAWVRTTGTIDPDPRRAAIYQERFLRYQDLYPWVRRWYEPTGRPKP
ncbi:MAG: FGGY-family carbohydrate kinase [Thermoguttaceae bacterium]